MRKFARELGVDLARVQGSGPKQRITQDVYDRIRTGARNALAVFTGPDGTVAAPLRGHLVAAHP